MHIISNAKSAAPEPEVSKVRTRIAEVLIVVSKDSGTANEDLTPVATQVGAAENIPDVIFIVVSPTPLSVSEVTQLPL
jgi:hypothetical protein